MLVVVILFGHNYSYSQNQTDAKMGEILNSGDLFRLKEEYPPLKGSISVKMLNLIAEAQLGIGFNQLENAAISLDSLLQL